ncbi:hypothetical protein WS96_04080 [Burkholderia sp. MSMB1835]|nr:hypothetical protein WS96_04080 [Burkholderia sp. MSMB1835]
MPTVVTSEKPRSTTRSRMKPIGMAGSDGAAAGAGGVFQSRGSGYAHMMSPGDGRCRNGGVPPEA